MINSVVGLLALFVFTSEARLPQKFVKAANGAGKALYATKFGYSTVPLPAHIVLQTNVNREEVHLTGGISRSRRPTTKRPRRRPVYASKYQDYTPNLKSQKNKPRITRPSSKRRPTKHRPPYNEPEYYDQDDLEEDIYDSEYEYDGRLTKHRENDEYEDFIGQHSKLHAVGYKKHRNTRGKKKTVEGTSHSEPTPLYSRKPTSYIKNWSGTSRPSINIYSRGPTRPTRLRDEERHIYEDNGEKRQRYKEKHKRHKTKQEYRYRDEEDDGYKREGGRYRYDSRERYPTNGYKEEEKKRERGESDNSKDRRNPHYREQDDENKRDSWDEESDGRRTKPKREKDNYWKGGVTDQDEESTIIKLQKSNTEKLKNYFSEQLKKWVEEYRAETQKKEIEKNRNPLQGIIGTHIPPKIWSTQYPPTHLPTWTDPPFNVFPSISPLMLPTDLSMNWNTQFQNQPNWNNPSQSTLDTRWLEQQSKLNFLSNEQNWGQKLKNKKEAEDRQNVNNGMTLAQTNPITNFEWKPEHIREGEITDHQKWKIQNYPFQGFTQNNPPISINKNLPSQGLPQNTPPSLTINQNPPPQTINQNPPPQTINQNPPPLTINQNPPPLIINQNPPPLTINQNPPPQRTTQNNPSTSINQNFPYQGIAHKKQSPSIKQDFQPPNLNAPVSSWSQTNIASSSKSTKDGEIIFDASIQDPNARKKEPDIGFGQGMEVYENKGVWQMF